MISKFNSKFEFKYENYTQSKQHRKVFTSIKFRDTQKLELIHICDSNRVLTSDGNYYFLMFIEGFFKFYYIYLLKIKDKVLSKFKIYKIEIKNKKFKIYKVEVKN